MGQRASISRVFTLKDVRIFAGVSGDRNALHLDPGYAESTTYGKSIVHGMLTASLFSTLLGTRLPGNGTVLVGQMLKFLKPVYVSETVNASVEILDVRHDERIVRLATTATTNRGSCIEGEAVVKFSRRSEGRA